MNIWDWGFGCFGFVFYEGLRVYRQRRHQRRAVGGRYMLLGLVVFIGFTSGIIAALLNVPDMTAALSVVLTPTTGAGAARSLYIGFSVPTSIKLLADTQLPTAGHEVEEVYRVHLSVGGRLRQSWRAYFAT